MRYREMSIRLIFLSGIISVLSFSGFAQVEEMELLKAQDIDALQIDAEDVFQNESFMLPPLTALIDSALVNSPLLKQYEALLEISQLEKEGVKHNWSKNIYGITEYKYGTTDNIILIDGVNPAQATSASGTSQQVNLFQVGAGLRISLYDLAQRKRQTSIAIAKYEYASAQRDEIALLIKREVTLLYNDVMLAQRMLAIKSETQQAKLLHFNLAEKQFLEGELAVSEYSKIIEMIAKSSGEYETAKMDFGTKYFLLEEAVGLKIDELKKALE